MRPIYARLSGYEKSEAGISAYLPELIKSIDVSAEMRRLRSVKFAELAPDSDAAPAATATVRGPSSVVPSGPPSSPFDDDLAEGQRQIAARNGAAAASSFERVLAASPDNVRAIYGLAVASALSGDAERARELFARIIAAAKLASGPNDSASTQAGTRPDPADVSWSHIYLGRMYDVEGHHELAVAEYQAALAVEGIPEPARSAAQRGADTGYQTPPRENKSDGKP